MPCPEHSELKIAEIIQKQELGIISSIPLFKARQRKTMIMIAFQQASISSSLSSTLTSTAISFISFQVLPPPMSSYSHSSYSPAGFSFVTRLLDPVYLDWSLLTSL